tara:strand:- start:9225 stop:9647 length:423 start_codon:yes stop_codon:yes gene_type:complete
MLNVSSKKLLTFFVAALFSLAGAIATPERKQGGKPPQCCINKEPCCLTKEKCCEDKRKPHRKPHGKKRPIDWEAKKAEFIKKFDKDGDGKISSDEKKAVIEEWKKRIGEKPHGQKRPHGRKPRPNGRHKPQRDEKTRRGQ